MMILGGEVRAVGREDFFHRGVFGEVGPFVGIGLSVVEFFRAIGEVNVAIVFRDDGDIFRPKATPGGVWPIGGRVLQEWLERVAFVPGIGLKLSEIEEGGVEVEELDGLVADLSLRDAGSCDDHRDARAILPDGALGPVVFFPEVEPVIREEDDDGVVLVGAGIEGVEDAPDLVVGEADTGEVGLDQGLPLVVFHDPLMGGRDVFESGEIDGVG